MGTKHIVPRAEGQGGIGTATLGWGELFITNTTADSSTQGGKLTLTSNDGNAMQSSSRLGVIEFKGAESDSALTIGARIEAICDAAWTATENGASLKFYTTDANASESLVLTLDSNKLAVFTGAVAINGDLTVNGTTTTVNSQIVTIDDPVFTLGGDTDHTSDDNKDRGIEFRYYSGSAKLGFFGWDDSASAFTFIADATNNSEVFSGTAGNAIFTNITGTLQTAAQTNITSVGALNGGTITSGFGAINNGASAITTTGLISGGSLDISGDADIDGTLETDALSINGTAVTASAADINLIDGITNGTVIASKAIITDSNKDITGGRNITISGTLTTGPFLANGISRVGSNGIGYDFVAYGTTSGKKLNWDSLEDELIIDGDLDVNGDAIFSGDTEIITSSTPTLQLTQSGATNYKGYVKLAGNDLEIRGSSGVMEFYNGSVDGNSSALRLSISSGGLVQVGDGTSQNTFLTTKSVAGWYSGIKLTRGLGDGSSTANNNFGMLVTDNGWEVATFTSPSNNVTGRSAKLVISSTGAATFNSSLSNQFIINSTETNGGYIRLQRGGADLGWIGSAYHTIAPTGANSDLAVNSVNGNLILATSSTERMRISSNGETTISTTASNAQTALTLSTASSAASLNFSNTGTSPSNWYIQSGGGITGALRFYSNVSGSTGYRMSLSSSGLATFSHDIELSRAARTTIYASSTNQGIQLKSNGSGVLQLNADGGGNVTIAENGGNVGIGKSPSTFRLDLETTSGGNGLKITRGTADFQVFQVANGASYVGTGNADTLHLITGGSSKMSISSGGDISFVGRSIGNGKNYATSQSWQPGAANTFDYQTGYYGGNFTNNGSTVENSVVWGNGPFGNRSLVWQTVGESLNDADGGWNKTITGLPSGQNHAYMSYVYVMRTSSATTGTFYYGCSSVLTLSGSSDTNPYFHVLGISALPQNVWCLAVGIIQAHTDTNTATPAMNGVYRMDTKAKINTGTSFRSVSSAPTTQQHRAYHYYSTNPSATLAFANPGFYVVDGSEPNLATLFG